MSLFLRESQVALGMESSRECGLLSLVYAPVALKSQVVAVVAIHIRKTWKYVRRGENEVCQWSSPLGRRNQCDTYTFLVICKAQLC